MASRNRKVICAVCANFEPQAWRKSMCRNCFHTLDEHDPAEPIANVASSSESNGSNDTFSLAESNSDRKGVESRQRLSESKQTAEKGTPTKNEQKTDSRTYKTSQAACDGNSDPLLPDNLHYITTDTTHSAEENVANPNKDVEILNISVTSSIDNDSGSINPPLDLEAGVVETVSIILPEENTESNVTTTSDQSSSMTNYPQQTAGIREKDQAIKFGNSELKIKDNSGNSDCATEKFANTSGLLSSKGKIPLALDKSKIPFTGKLKDSSRVHDKTNHRYTQSESDKIRPCLRTIARDDESASISRSDPSDPTLKSKELGKTRISKIAVKSDVGRKADCKTRRNSASSNGASSEENHEKKLSVRSASVSETNSRLVSKPSTPPMSKRYQKDEKPTSSSRTRAAVSSPKSSPKLSKGNKRFNTDVVGDIEQQLKDLKEQCEILRKEKNDTVKVLNEKIEEEKKLVEINNILTMRADDLEEKCKSIQTLRESLNVSMKKEDELKHFVSLRDAEIETLRHNLNDTKTDMETLQDENATFRLEIQEMKQEMDEMYDQFREAEVDEFRDLQKELEITSKNCRLLQFKLRKSERKNAKAESERLQYENKIKSLSDLLHDEDAKTYIKALEEELLSSKTEIVHWRDEIDIVEEKRHRVDEENRRLQEILETTDKKQFRMEMEIDKLHDQVDELRRQLRDGNEYSDDEAISNKIIAVANFWRD